ncbi:MAG: hypothetical protein ACLUNV_08875 [Sutterella wadsworthensis]
MTVSLLTNGGDANYEWSAMVGTSDLRELYRLLEIGPYRHLRDMSPMAVYKRWQTEIHVGLLVLLLLILNEFRLRGLVAKRTSGSPTRSRRLRRRRPRPRSCATSSARLNARTSPRRCRA